MAFQLVLLLYIFIPQALCTINYTTQQKVFYVEVGMFSG